MIVWDVQKFDMKLVSGRRVFFDKIALIEIVEDILYFGEVQI